MGTITGQKKVVHVFDVDGTLTKGDSLLLLIDFECISLWRKFKLIVSVAPFVPVAILKNDTGMIKERALQKLWKRRNNVSIEMTGKVFFEKKLRPDLRPAALAYIRQLRQAEPDSIFVLLSASCREWLQPLASFLKTELICTELEYDAQQRFTGWFSTPNCKGPEKVKRLIERYPIADHTFICYANDKSDKVLQSVSEQFFYRYF